MIFRNNIKINNELSFYKHLSKISSNIICFFNYKDLFYGF